MTDTVNTIMKEVLAAQGQALGAEAVAPLFKLEQPGQLVRHTDGGIYRYVGDARHTEDQSVMVLYLHVWPFEASDIPWARPAEMWATRFTKVTEQDLAQAMCQDREAAQRAVTAAKAARRAAEATRHNEPIGVEVVMRASVPPFKTAPDFEMSGASGSKHIE